MANSMYATKIDRKMSLFYIVTLELWHLRCRLLNFEMETIEIATVADAMCWEINRSRQTIVAKYDWHRFEMLCNSQLTVEHDFIFVN